MMQDLIKALRSSLNLATGVCLGAASLIAAYAVAAPESAAPAAALACMLALAIVAGVFLHSRRITARIEAAHAALAHAAQTQRAQAARLQDETQQLAQAHEAALQANRANSEFLARVSHELRTPLNSIVGYAQLVEMNREGRLSTTQREHLAAIHQSSNMLLALFDDILDLSKLGAGRLRLHLQPLALHPTVAQCVDMLTPLARDKQITVHNQCTTTLSCWVRGDLTRIRQVVINLLTNAIKYNQRHGSVTLSCHHLSHDRVRFEVSDTGIGIPDDARERLFEPFERLTAHQSHADGHGIGLALAQELITQMDGSIGVNSTPGRGSTFWFELPAVDPAAVDVPHNTGVEVRGAEQTPDQLHTGYEVLCIHSPGVEDVEQVLRGFEHISTRKAISGHLALEIARRHPPRLVIMGQTPADIDGITLLKRLRALPALSDVPVLFVAETAAQTEAVQSLKLDDLELCRMPVGRDRVRQLLEHYLPADRHGDGSKGTLAR